MERIRFNNTSILYQVQSITLEDRHYINLNCSETNDEASDNEDEVDEMIIDTCLICCQPKQGTFALVPCGHANLCKNCGQHSKDENKPCPVCRSDIMTIMQIFQ